MTAKRTEAASSLRRAALALDEDPGGSWVAGLVHHGSRILLLLITSVAIYGLFPAPRLPDTAVLEPGTVAPQDVIAEFSFNIPKSPDELLREQVEAASGVPAVYDLLPWAADSVVAAIEGLFEEIEAAATTGVPAERAEVLADVLESNRLSPTPAAIELLVDPQRRQALLQSVVSAVREHLPAGVAPGALPSGVSAIHVRSPNGMQRLVQRDSVLTPDRFYSLAAEDLRTSEAEAAQLQRLLLIRFFRASLVPNEAATEAVRERARAAVDPVRSTVVQGEKIVGAHERIGEEEEARLQAYQAELTRRGMGGRVQEGTITRALGAILYNAVVLSLFGLLLFFFRPPLYRNWRALVLFTLLVLSVAGAGALISRFGLPPELIPVTFASLIVAVLWDGRLGFSLAMILALLIGGQTPFLGVTALFTAAVGGSAAAFSVRVVERRSKTWLFISIISLAYIAAAITMALLRSRDLSDMGMSMTAGITNAIVASLLAIGFLPLLESFTGITTDQTLLELSDLNRKLLKRLSLEAPGTYAHTVNVANLAEAASSAIGANGLLARVGAYYHDIGKLVKPQYFIENQPRGRNPHDKIKPSTSSSIIRGHIAEGLKLAEADRLPEIVKRFIPEHHGTQQIAFFYNRAKESDPDGNVNATEFTYAGPKPQSKETAILMMADTVESATRVLQDPTPVRIRELVDRLIGQKIAEGQLDEAPLTLREIGLIKDSLTNVLTGMYHHRIDYPGTGS